MYPAGGTHRQATASFHYSTKLVSLKLCEESADAFLAEGKDVLSGVLILNMTKIFPP